jgi:aminopeptidase
MLDSACSGGISIKPAASMDDMRGDMGGAATTFSAFWAITTLQLPINVSLFIPLTENLIGPSATKPGDNVVAANGVTINVINTDAEGRLVLADALYYASTQVPAPHTLINAATLTGAIGVALGDQFAGVFTNSDSLFEELDTAAKCQSFLSSLVIYSLNLTLWYSYKLK